MMPIEDYTYGVKLAKACANDLEKVLANYNFNSQDVYGEETIKGFFNHFQIFMDQVIDAYLQSQEHYHG